MGQGRTPRRRRPAAQSPFEPLEPRAMMCEIGAPAPLAPDVAAHGLVVAPDTAAGPGAGPRAAASAAADKSHLPTRPSRAWTTGVKRVLYLRVTFADQPSHRPQTVESARNLMAFADAFVRANSYGKTSFHTTYTDVIVLPHPASHYGVNGWREVRDDALATAKAIRPTWDAKRFNLDVIRYDGGPAPLGGRVSGFAHTGGRGTWLRTDEPETAMHELGHNLGLDHANAWRPADPDAPGAAGLHGEYGNPFDIMGQGGGAGAGGHFNAYAKHFLRWLPDSAVATVETSGRYTVHPADTGAAPAANRFLALKVRKDGGRDYWLSSRADRFWADKPSLRGLEVNWNAWWHDHNANSAFGSHLLDMTPQPSADFYDAGLPLGRTFTDPVAGVHVTPLRRDPTGAVEVAVHLDTDQPHRNQFAPDPVQIVAAGAPTNAHPDDSAYPYPVVTVPAGRAFSLTAFSRDLDGDALAYSWDFGPSAAGGAVGPGGAAVRRGPPTSIATTPAAEARYDAPGFYRARVTLSDLRGHTASASVLVRVTPPSASGEGATTAATTAQTATAAAPAPAPSNTNVITGRVTDALGAPVQNARVGDSTRWTYTDADGTYALVGLDDSPRSPVASKAGGWVLRRLGTDGPVEPAAPARGVDFRATPVGYQLTGTVTTLGGAAVPGVVVSDGSLTAVTDDLGRYTLPAFNGVYDLTFTKPGYPIAPLTDVLVDHGDAVADAVADLRPLVGSVQLLPVNGAATIAYGHGVGQVTTVGSAWRFDHVPRGNWVLTATGPGEDGRTIHYKPIGWSNPMWVDGRGAPRLFDFVRPQRGEYVITGRVTRGAGAGAEGVAGALVEVFDPANRNRVVATTFADNSGKYIVYGLRARTYGLSVRAGGEPIVAPTRRIALTADRVEDFRTRYAPLNRPPKMTAPVAAEPAVVTGVSTWLTAGATDDRDADRLVYAWDVVRAPAGAGVAFSRTDSTTARRTFATFDRAGVYLLRATARDRAGARASAFVTVTVAPVLSAIRLDRPSVVLAPGESRRFTAVALDQFGRPMPDAPPISWSAAGTAGSVAPDGTFTAAATGAAERGAVLASATGASGETVTASALVQSRPHAAVVGRHFFYNDSAFDGFDPAVDESDDGAVDPDKHALRPGEGPATTANVSTYDKGINGVMVDFGGGWGRTLTTDDFEFAVGHGSGAAYAPGDAGWAPAPPPIGVWSRTAHGRAGPVQRVTLTWEEAALRDLWLRVTVRATARTGLSAADVFYFGNLVGDTGDAGPGDTVARVTPNDVEVTLRHQQPWSDPGTPHDFDRGYGIDETDAEIARRNEGAWITLMLAGVVE